MSRYIRAFVPGGTFFFTVVLLERRSRLLIEHADVLRSVFAAVRARRLFSINAMVVLPDHLHCIWTLPQGDTREIFARFLIDGLRDACGTATTVAL